VARCHTNVITPLTTVMLISRTFRSMHFAAQRRSSLRHLAALILTEWVLLGSARLRIINPLVVTVQPGVFIPQRFARLGTLLHAGPEPRHA
jgi:hypothetical protein